VTRLGSRAFFLLLPSLDRATGRLGAGLRGATRGGFSPCWRRRRAGGVIVAEFREVESGKRDNQPQIATALAACRLRHATLIIAKLNRLARNVHFIPSLMGSGNDFVACDNPHAMRLTIHILASVAEHERHMISARTIAAGRRKARAQARQPEFAGRQPQSWS
jgi:DNA invertase Pin-like site-specific DNA recombinase